MARKSTKIKTFSERMTDYTAGTLDDKNKVRIAKNVYLLDNKDAILRAKAEGYNYRQIAEVATIALLETNVPRKVTFTNREGEELERETELRAGEIKNFCEPEQQA